MFTGKLCLNSSRISPELLRDIEQFNGPVRILTPEQEEARNVDSREIFGKARRTVKIVLNSDLYDGPGSITSEINDMTDNGELRSLTTTIVATMSLADVFRWSLFRAVKMISLVEPDEDVRPPATAHNIPSDLNGC